MTTDANTHATHAEPPAICAKCCGTAQRLVEKDERFATPDGEPIRFAFHCPHAGGALAFVTVVRNRITS